VGLLQARDEADVDRILFAFYRQKEARFPELGISDPFAGDAIQAFSSRRGARGLAAGAPAVELYGLPLEARS
jgi:CelD/BcsL family acetyltransferase involved in cellulose biosynthesis